MCPNIFVRYGIELVLSPTINPKLDWVKLTAELPWRTKCFFIFFHINLYPRTGTHVYPWEKRSNYSTAFCSRFLLSFPLTHLCGPHGRRFDAHHGSPPTRRGVPPGRRSSLSAPTAGYRRHAQRHPLWLQSPALECDALNLLTVSAQFSLNPLVCSCDKL